MIDIQARNYLSHFDYEIAIFSLEAIGHDIDKLRGRLLSDMGNGGF
jgi:hypothetical protein